MGKRPALLTKIEKLIIAAVLLFDCVVFGIESSGRLAYPWMKGIAGLLLVAIGLYIFWKVKKGSDDSSE